VDVQEGGGGFVRQASQNYLPSRDDVLVPFSIARDYALRDGTEIEGLARDAGGGRRVLVEVQKASGLSPEEYRALPHFQDLISVNPNEAFRLAGEQAETSLRVIDLIAPIGRGQRGLIVSPPKAGKTTLLEHLGQSIAKHHPEVHLILLLIDERPEEVTHFRRQVPVEVIASSSDQGTAEHVRVANLCMAQVRCELEAGHHVVVLVDSLTRMGRAFNVRGGSDSGRTMSGGIDARALEIPRQFFGMARNVENGGSVTVLATALIETGSRMDDLIFEEFKGTGNSEIVLDRALADQRVFPAINIAKTGTRREELLYSAPELAAINRMRRQAIEMPPKQAILDMLKVLETFPTNEDLLKRVG
jgi:transcription termination factor Rho